MNLFRHDSRLSRYWYLLRYHRASQLVRRALKVAQRRIQRGSLAARYGATLGRPVGFHQASDLVGWAEERLADHELELEMNYVSELVRGEFSFLNQQRQLPDPIDWRLNSWPEVPHLWRFHLHYHHFLLDLVVAGRQTGQGAFLERAWDIVWQWLAGNQPRDRSVDTDAWHPYCISRRVPVWISMCLVTPPSEAMLSTVLGSIYQQARFLAHHLERDVGGNHLLENLRTLVIAGRFFPCRESDRWLHLAARHLRRELARQILPHGEHFERSPMYHAEMLGAILDIRETTRQVNPEISELSDQAATKMAVFLQDILHPDGNIPLLSDSALGHVPSIQRRIERALLKSESPAKSRSDIARAASSIASDRDGACNGAASMVLQSDGSAAASAGQFVGDYWVFRSGVDYLLFDTGAVGPEELSAHAHADLLNVEASVGGQRLIVDAGVFDYDDGQMRQYCRSSAAHNVLLVDGADQCDMWSRFRMGYRGWPNHRLAGESSGFHWARAVHNAYRRLGVPVVGRWIACCPGGPWLSVDWAEGTRRCLLASRLHFHPNVQVESCSNRTVRLVLANRCYWLQFLTLGDVTVGDAWYCPGFGQRERTDVVEWANTCDLPTVTGWVLFPDTSKGRCELDLTTLNDPRVRWTERGKTTELRPFSNSTPRNAGPNG